MKTTFGAHDQTSYSLIEEHDSIGKNILDKELQMGEAKCAALPGHCLEAYGTILVKLVVLWEHAF